MDMQADARESTKESAGTVVVLGGSGFIGSQLTELLCDRGFNVRIGDLVRSERFPRLWTQCDVRRHETLLELCRGAQAIINLAAEHRDDVRPVSRYHETNVDGAREVCKAASASGVSKIIFTSSVAVYGFHPHAVDESGSFAPFNLYGSTKLEAERVYLDWAQQAQDRALVIVRPTVVFGEKNRGNVYNLLHQIASGRFLMVGPGDNVKSMAYVLNVAAFLAYSLRCDAGVHIFNYADGPDLDVNSLVGFVRECLGRKGSVLRLPKWPVMIAGHLLDLVARLTGRSFPVSAIRIRKFCETTQFLANRVAQTGFKAPYSLRDGLARTIQYEFSGK